MLDEVPQEKTAKVDSINLQKDPISDEWTSKDGSVLLKDRIKFYCDDQKIKMIVGYEAKLLEPASYQLRLGGDYRIEGKNKKITSQNQTLVIPPHGLVIVRTYEYINLPCFLIGRWNLKVKMVYKGLVWVGGPQVDPGFQGFLSCPLYNLSNKEVKLKFKDPLFIIDFVRTSYNQNAEPWEPKTSAIPKSLEDLDLDGLVSAPKAQLDQVKNEVKVMKAEIRAIVIGMMSALSLVTAIIAIIIGFQIFTGKIDWGTVNINWLHFDLSIFAVVLASAALVVGIIGWFKRL